MIIELNEKRNRRPYTPDIPRLVEVANQNSLTVAPPPARLTFWKGGASDHWRVSTVGNACCQRDIAHDHLELGKT